MAKPEADTVEVVSHRTFTLPTLTGRTLAFEKGVPIRVPRHILEEVMKAGVVPSDEGNLPKYEENPKAPDGAPVDPSRRKSDLKAAIVQLRASNSRESFAASGQPKVGAVEKILGWDTSAKEIAVVMQEIHDEEAGEA